ncbi:hypothetical protein [Streptomyces sp. TLI_146]|uniref:hypothetical protein n=1 Tax=Streptomyces sp. TLI_146 TaxID=1938858 RepID=UPI000C705088|nr:hypothetical protein [Streptomyces sp. TLI_146]PKV82586.1 hypothetical protein BX283_0019 [Streptomyces sp. TLI_146]
MTKTGSNGPKARTRARQQHSQQKYTQALRSASPATPQNRPPGPAHRDDDARTFRLGDLLTECTTFPAVAIEDDNDKLSFGFESKILGCKIPSATVLSLAGALSREGIDTELAVESITHHSIVVTAPDWADFQRLEMSLTDEWTIPLCPVAHCSNHSMRYQYIDRCHTHLPQCDTATLIQMGTWWAQSHSDALAADPARTGGDRAADLLVKAAVHQGSSAELITVLLRTLFVDEADIDEIIWDEAEALDLRHAIGRERLRLNTSHETKPGAYARAQGHARPAAADPGPCPLPRPTRRSTAHPNAPAHQPYPTPAERCRRLNGQP